MSTSRPCRPRAPSGRRAAGLACLAVTLAAPSAWADGYNDWTGNLAGPGEVYLVPALSLRAAPGEAGRVAESFPQLQLQIGLSEKVDVILAAATLWRPGTAVHDWIYLQPRVQLLEGLAFSPGVNLQAHAEGDPWALAPGLFYTVSPEGWQLTWNLIYYATPRDWRASSVFFVTVVERVLDDTWSFYGELDVFHYPAAPVEDATVTLFAGVMINLSETDTVNICVYSDVRPAIDLPGTAVGVWWSHGFEVSPR